MRTGNQISFIKKKSKPIKPIKPKLTPDQQFEIKKTKVLQMEFNE